MSLNIKNKEAHQLATELARLRKVSVTQAVLDAVRAELEREKQKRSGKSLAEELLEFGRRFSTHMEPGTSSTDTDFLYDDETGLPR